MKPVRRLKAEVLSLVMSLRRLARRTRGNRPCRSSQIIGRSELAASS